MPGPLTQAHAELEGDCSQCHARFDQGAQNSLCLNCHEDVAGDLAAGQGFHGVNPAVSWSKCSVCHTDHKGRQTDTTGLVAELFDHSMTDFPLQGVHARAACGDCHNLGEPYRSADTACSSCHQEDDTHQGVLGEACADCHNPNGWSEILFDHRAQTDFPLTGAHTSPKVTCSACHARGDFLAAPTQCAGCHELDDVHDGDRGSDCRHCHTTDAWTDTKFDHAAHTDFELLGRHSQLACRSCHLADMMVAEPARTCVGCHTADDTHQGRNGDQCGSCHGNTSWQVEFDHLQASGFALQGAHQQLTCSACHRGAITDPIESACYACHVDDDPHAGTLTACGDCHGVNSWSTEIRFHHDLTAFPLIGVHKLTTCEQCHSGLEFTHSLGGECGQCHRDDDVHQDVFGVGCGECHTAVGWNYWDFEHGDKTSFALTGAHRRLECAACHTVSAAQPLASSCGSCHRRDDPHRGSFGAQCARCHTTESFATPKIGRVP